MPNDAVAAKHIFELCAKRPVKRITSTADIDYEARDMRHKVLAMLPATMEQLAKFLGCKQGSVRYIMRVRLNITLMLDKSTGKYVSNPNRRIRNVSP